MISRHLLRSPGQSAIIMVMIVIIIIIIIVMHSRCDMPCMLHAHHALGWDPLCSEACRCLCPPHAELLQAMADTRPFTETIRVDSADLTSMPSWIRELAEYYGIQWILGVSVEITTRESGDVGISGEYVRISACVGGGGDKFPDGGDVVVASSPSASAAAAPQLTVDAVAVYAIGPALGGRVQRQKRAPQVLDRLDGDPEAHGHGGRVHRLPPSLDSFQLADQHIEDRVVDHAS